MGLYRRGKVWWMTIIYDGGRVRRSTGTADRRLAQAILAKLQVQIIEGRFFETREEKQRTFGEMVQRYLQEVSVTKAPGSTLRDRQCADHLLPCFGDKLVYQVSSKLLGEYKVKRRADGAAPATINKELGMVRHLFNVAIREWEWCRENPMHRVSMEPVHNARDRWLTADEEGRLLSVSPSWLQELITFALNTGMRRGEILGLKWQDVDLARGVLVVMKSKNKEHRTIPLNARVFELLVEKQSRRVKSQDLVFTTSSDTMRDERNLTRGFYVALEKSGVENLTFHDLRHTFATRLVHAGVDLYKVQRLLGHKSPVMTQRYAHHSPESLRDGVAVLDRLTTERQSQFSHNQLPAERALVVSGGKVGAGNGI